LLQKRKYTKGFYLNLCERNSEKQKTELSNIIHGETPATTESNKSKEDLLAIAAPSCDPQLSISNIESIGQRDRVITLPYKHKMYSLLPDIKTERPQRKIIFKKKLTPTVKDESPLYNPLAVTAFALYILSVFLTFIALKEWLIGFLVAAVLMQLASIILGIIALIQFHNHPEQKGRAFAKIPVIMFIIGLALALVGAI